MDNSAKVNASGNDIDISRVPNEDHDKLASAIESFYKQDGTAKTRLSYHWERTMRFLDGDQWLVYDNVGNNGTGAWSRLQVSKANEYIPRPVTNYMFDIYQTLKSYLTKTKPSSKVIPNNPYSFRDKSAAKIAELCIDANYERLKDWENYEYAAACMLTYGTVFKKTYWDATAGNVVKLPRMVEQPRIDPMTGQPMGMTQVNELDEYGQPIFDTMPIGDINTAVIEPFRIALDPLANDLHTARWVMEYSIQPLSWIQETYGKEGDGYTGRVDDVKEETQLSGSMRRFAQLKNSSGVKSSAILEGANANTGTAELSNSAVVKELYCKPSAMHPKGRLVVVANGVCLYAGDSPCEGIDQGDWHPYSECRWEIVPGRFWGKSPLDNVCELQKRANSIMATIILTRKTMAIPQKLVPAGSGIEPGQWTGRPGQVLTYRTEAGIPQTIPATGVDVTVFKELEMLQSDMKSISGAIDILKGDRPPGVNAASALSLLYEVGTGKLFPVLDRWKRFIENDQKKELRLIASKYKEPREDYIALIKSRNKELPEEAINKFIGTDLWDNCNVTVESGSNVPKLEAMRQMRLQEAAQVGSLQLELPANRMEYNRQMGIVGFDNDVGPDVKRAEYENDVIDNILQNPEKRPVVFVCDDDAVHIQVHERRIKEPAFMELPLEVQQAYFEHVEEHNNAIAMKQQQEMMQAMMTGQAPQQEASGMDPTKTKENGRGAPNSLREQEAKADLPPGMTPGN